MRINRLILAAFVICLSFTACDKLDTLPVPDLSNDEVVQGLKEALRVGTDTSVTTLHKEDGYFADQAVKIFLPPEAQVIKENISLVPGGDQLVEALIKKINRSAEDAAVEAKPIFVDAITNITITDGLNILNGADTAATHYLKENTYNSLKDLFQPKIETSLSKPIIGGISAQSSYASLVNIYNDAAKIKNLIPLGKQYAIVQDTSLSAYTTKRALSGLFLKIADEEKAIRTDPIARVTDILKKVFSKQ